MSLALDNLQLLIMFNLCKQSLQIYKGYKISMCVLLPAESGRDFNYKLLLI